MRMPRTRQSLAMSERNHTHKPPRKNPAPLRFSDRLSEGVSESRQQHHGAQAQHHEPHQGAQPQHPEVGHQGLVQGLPPQVPDRSTEQDRGRERERSPLQRGREQLREPHQQQLQQQPDDRTGGIRTHKVYVYHTCCGCHTSSIRPWQPIPNNDGPSQILQRLNSYRANAVRQVLPYREHEDNREIYANNNRESLVRHYAPTTVPPSSPEPVYYTAAHEKGPSPPGHGGHGQ